MEYLFSFAELSIGFAGVAALIMLLVDKNSKQWNDFQFTGLLGHCLSAFLFCLLPFLVEVFTPTMQLSE